ncbi:MAG: hypothetical protein AAF518_11565 [Spirochaetota bacterium]
MALSPEQISLLQKYQKIVSQLEYILKNSRNPRQRERVSKDLDKYKYRILSISPEGIPDSFGSVTNSTDNHPTSHEEEGESQDTTRPASPSRRDPLENLVVMKISPHCNDNEINLIATLLNLLDEEYSPVLGDSHLKLDFTHATERDNLMKHLENIHRNMKVLTETIEEYALCDKQDFKEQLGRMKNKQSRIFIAEAGDVFVQFRDFIHKIFTDNQDSGGSVILNLKEEVNFNSRFERATLLEGRTVEDSLEQFYDFTKSALENINIPSIRR